MSKKKKHKGFNLIRVEEENDMGNEWFYLNDISWFKTVDGRIVTPVKGVVTHLSEPIKGFRFMSTKAAKQCIVDIAPFGKCYEKRALESLWDKINGHGVSEENRAESDDRKDKSKDRKDCTDEKNVPSEEGQFVNCQKFSEDSEARSEDDAKNA